MEKKIMIDIEQKKNLLEIWEYNRKGFYNFKEYIPLDKFNIKLFKKQYKKYTIIDKKHLLESLDDKSILTDTGILIHF